MQRIKKPELNKNNYGDGDNVPSGKVKEAARMVTNHAWPVSGAVRVNSPPYVTIRYWKSMVTAAHV